MDSPLLTDAIDVESGSNLIDTSTSEICKICFEDENEMTKLPCGHYLCIKCKAKIKNKICPWCRASYGDSLKKPKQHHQQQDCVYQGICGKLFVLAFVVYVVLMAVQSS